MKVEIIRKNTGYNGHNHYIDLASNAANYDMTEEVESSYSLGWDEPIIVNGTCPKYRLDSVDVEEWTITGLEKSNLCKDSPDPKARALWYAALIASGDLWTVNNQRDLLDAVYRLTGIVKPSPFKLSLRSFFESRGFLTPKQINAVLDPPSYKNNFKRR